MDEVIYEAAGNAYSRGPLSSTQEPEDATASFYGVRPFREAPRSIVKAVSQSIQDELHRHGQQEKEWEI